MKANAMRTIQITFFTLAIVAHIPLSLAAEHLIKSPKNLTDEVIAHMDKYIGLANKADASSIAKEIYEALF